MKKHRTGRLTDKAVAFYRYAARPVDTDELLVQLDAVAAQHNILLRAGARRLADAVGGCADAGGDACHLG